MKNTESFPVGLVKNEEQGTAAATAAAAVEATRIDYDSHTNRHNKVTRTKRRPPSDGRAFDRSSFSKKKHDKPVWFISSFRPEEREREREGTVLVAFAYVGPFFSRTTFHKPTTSQRAFFLHLLSFSFVVPLLLLLLLCLLLFTFHRLGGCCLFSFRPPPRALEKVLAGRRRFVRPFDGPDRRQQ